MRGRKGVGEGGNLLPDSANSAEMHSIRLIDNKFFDYSIGLIPLLIRAPCCDSASTERLNKKSRFKLLNPVFDFHENKGINKIPDCRSAPLSRQSVTAESLPS